MKARRLGVSTIWAMFSLVTSKTSGSSLASRKVSTSFTKASCSGEKSKFITASMSPGRAGSDGASGRKRILGQPRRGDPVPGRRGGLHRSKTPIILSVWELGQLFAQFRSGGGGDLGTDFARPHQGPLFQQVSAVVPSLLVTVMTLLDDRTGLGQTHGGCTGVLPG